MRTTTEVMHSHLMLRLKGDPDADIEENYHSDVVVLSRSGEFHGHEGVRMAADELSRLVDATTFAYNQTVVSGPYAFLEWTADGEQTVHDGADSFVIEEGLIVMQSIHYRPHPR